MKKKEHESSQEKKGNTDDDTISINFSAIKQKTKKFFSIFSALNKTTITIALIILVMFAAFFVRYYATTYPVTHDYATQTIENNIKNNIAQQIMLQNPAMPEANLQQETNKQYATLYKQNKQEIKNQIAGLEQQFKDQLEDDKGVHYLTDIDSYLWYSYAKWYDRNGGFYTEIKDGEKIFGLRKGRFGEPAGFFPQAFTIALIHKTFKIFSPDIDIMTTTALITPILMMFAVIPAFFLGRKIGGNNTAGFISASMVALMPSILGRTITADNDAQTFIFPLLIIWFFLETIEAEKLTKKITFGALTGLSIALFQINWSGWWFITGLTFGMIGLLFLYKIIKTYYKKGKINDYWNNVKNPIYSGAIIGISVLLIVTILALLIGTSPTSRIKELIDLPLQPINFALGFKGAATGVGVGGTGLSYPLWPNVFTTVAELNPGNPTQNIGAGGGLFFVIIAIIGIIFLLMQAKQDEKHLLYAALITIWFVSTYYAGLIGIRFTALFAPVVIIGIAAFSGYITGEKLKATSKKMNVDHFVLKAAVVLILLLIFIVKPFPSFTEMGSGTFYFKPFKEPIAMAKSSVPMYDDTWERAMITINQDDEKGIITSWWDFGHWFQARSERTVTFDGGDQGKRIHWVGLSLLTEDENEAVDILRMLNCGQETSNELLENYTQDRLEATKVLKTIIRLDKEDAYDELISEGLTKDEANNVLKYTHCEDLWSNYFITSEDMVGKAAVWGHFGSWNFDKAYAYYKLRSMPAPQAISEAKEKFGYTEEQARQIYIEVQNLKTENEAGNWISPWPSYITGELTECMSQDNFTSTCEYNIGLNNQNGIVTVLWRSIINKTSPMDSFMILRGVDSVTGSAINQQIIYPEKIVYEEDGEYESELKTENTIPISMVITNENGNYKTLLTHSLLSESLFTKLFFLEGRGTENFEKIFDERDFRRTRIIVWKVKQ